jgi:hypothetical protein
MPSGLGFISRLWLRVSLVSGVTVHKICLQIPEILKVSFTNMAAQDCQKHFLVVGASSILFAKFDMTMLRSL